MKNVYLFFFVMLVLFFVYPKNTFAQSDAWTWVNGDSITFATGIHGIKGVPSAINKPEVRSGTFTWTDSTGNFWMFGGGTTGGLFTNDLWKFNTQTRQWTWVNGDSSAGFHVGIYGTRGVASPTNKPGARESGSSWIDASGNFWLFGGYGISAQNQGHLNDLWKYSPATNQWTWMNGDTLTERFGNYGVMGIQSSANKPGSRENGVPWTDKAGNLWLFGGYGRTASSYPPYLNDLWKYNIATNQWTWTHGDSSGNSLGMYGIQGTPSPANKPSARWGAVSCVDTAGNFWLFGGYGYSNPSISCLNDLWKYNVVTNQWTWMKGSDGSTTISNQYGTLGVGSATTNPGGRERSNMWKDKTGNLWIFGGQDLRQDNLNDLWMYDMMHNVWIWMNGDSIVNVKGIYGNRGIATARSKPGARHGSASWTDTSGNFWLFGGDGFAKRGSLGPLNDLWRYEPNLDYNTLLVTVFLDQNANGIKDAGERLCPYADIKVIKQGVDTFSAHSSTGLFRLQADTGTYVTQAFASRPYFNLVPSADTTSHTTYFNTDTVAFAMQPIIGFKDVSINIIPITALRPGFNALYKILLTNWGIDTASGRFYLVKDSSLIYLTSSVTSTGISGDTIKWSYSKLAPLDTTSVNVFLKVKASPVVRVGDTLRCSANVASLAGETNLQDNENFIAQRVRGSFDPNDKTENHGGKITTTQVTAGDYLQYTVRFQNTGNDTAFNVYIHDTLDNKLDWNTLQILTASHNYQMTMTDGNKCLFTFRNINLVDSGANEPASHGYIVYRIKPKPTVQVGDIINNTAAIYFDYNLPVYTNTEMTTVVAESFPLKLLAFTARKQDKTNLLNWSTANEINVDHFIVERSTNGRDFTAIGTVTATNSGNYSYTDPTTNEKQETLFYRLKMLDKDGQFTYSPIRQININHLQLTIAPNPAHNIVTISGTNLKTIILVDNAGRTVLTKAAGNNQPVEISIGHLPKGLYLLTATTADGNTQSEKLMVK